MTAARYRRVPPDTRDTLTAVATGLGVAAAVGLTAFYLTRMWLAREPLAQAEPPPGSGESEPKGDGGA